MPERCLLVKVPAYPFTTDVLRPDRYLATLAGLLQEENVATKILDHGTLEGVDRLRPDEHRTSLDTSSSGPESISLLMDRWRSIAHPKKHTQRQEMVWRSIAQEIIDDRNVDLVVFNVDRAEDLTVLRVLIPHLRYARRSLPVIGVGAYFRADESHLVDGVSLFDCVYWGDCDSGFMHLVNAVDDQQQWSAIPLVAYSDSVRMVVTHEVPEERSQLFVRPIYTEDVYPALHQEQKLRIFDVEEVRTDNEGRGVLVKSPESVTEEIAALVRNHGTRAFNIVGATGTFRHAEALAYELLARRIHIRYTRDCHVASTPGSTVAALSSSGCHAVSFQIDTGSQRLLDRHYQHPFTVTEVEQTLRACNFSRLFTIMRLAYPGIEDDYHTMAETLRLVDRTKPGSATISVPPQKRRSLTDLRERFRTAHHRSLHEIHRDHKNLCGEIEQRGISTRITAPLSLMAELAGCNGAEQEFAEELDFILMTGDLEELTAIAETVNANAARLNNAVRFKPFSDYQDVVGN